MVAYQVDDLGAGAPRIVKVGDPIGKTRSAVEERHRRFPCHPSIAVGTACDNGLSHTEYAAHGLSLVKGNDELYLRGAGIGEANFNTRGDEGTD